MFTFAYARSVCVVKIYVGGNCVSTLHRDAKVVSGLSQMNDDWYRIYALESQKVIDIVKFYVEHVYQSLNKHKSEFNKALHPTINTIVDKCYKILYNLYLINKVIAVQEIYISLLDRPIMNYPLSFENYLFLTRVHHDICNMQTVIEDCIQRFVTSEQYFITFLGAIDYVYDYYILCATYEPPVQLPNWLMEAIDYVQ